MSMKQTREYLANWRYLAFNIHSATLCDHLLTIGMGPGEDGIGLDWSSTRLSLFNITVINSSVDDILSLTPVTNPASNEWVWSYSEASYEHKAFQILGAERIACHTSFQPTNTRLRTEFRGYYNWNYVFVSD